MSRMAVGKSVIKAEARARHSVAIFLIIYTLIDLDIGGRNTEEERRKATAMWLGWGIPFLLLAFFIITPEQERIEKGREEKRVSHPVRSFSLPRLPCFT